METPRLSSKRSRKDNDDSDTDAKFWAPDKPSFQTLPPEIRSLVLGYLDIEPYALLAVSATCKTWFSSLSEGETVERDFKRRCRTLKIATKPAAGQSWRSLYFSFLKDRCAGCHFRGQKSGLINFSLLLPDMPGFIEACEICTNKAGGPFQIVPLTYYPIKDRWLPFFTSAPHRNKYLRTSIENFIEIRKKRRDDRRRSALIAYEGDREVLKLAFSAGDVDSGPYSVKLGEMVEDFLESVVPEKRRLQPIVDYYLRLKKLEGELDILRESVGLQHGLRDPAWDDTATLREPGKPTWIEFLDDGGISPDEFLRYLRDNRKFRVFTPCAPAAVGQGCSAAVLCLYHPNPHCSIGRCYKHCLGPCIEHRKTAETEKCSSGSGEKAK